jgi:hypothetical protein
MQKGCGKMQTRDMAAAMGNAALHEGNISSFPTFAIAPI